MSLQMQDITYSETSEPVYLSGLTPVEYSCSFDWTPDYGIKSMKALGASDKVVYGVFNRWLKPKYFIKRMLKR